MARKACATAPVWVWAWIKVGGQNVDLFNLFNLFNVSAHLNAGFPWFDEYMRGMYTHIVNGRVRLAPWCPLGAVLRALLFLQTLWYTM